VGFSPEGCTKPSRASHLNHSHSHTATTRNHCRTSGRTNNEHHNTTNNRAAHHDRPAYANYHASGRSRDISDAGSASSPSDAQRHTAEHCISHTWHKHANSHRPMPSPACFAGYRHIDWIYRNSTQRGKQSGRDHRAKFTADIIDQYEQSGEHRINLSAVECAVEHNDHSGGSPLPACNSSQC
jgi:hypothetical protein